MSFNIIGKYIKDLNYNIPDPETFFSLPKNISNYKINIDIKSTQIKNKIIEIQTTLGLYPTKKKLKEINTKIIYSTIVELTDEITDKQEVEKIILIKVPTSIYPDLRKIFVFLFENSGFKEVNIARSVDFQKLYQLRKIQ
jgi:preprotein translocase subunit SecB